MRQQTATDRNRLTNKQRQAIQLLAAGDSVKKVAGQIAVDRSTVHRWLSDNEDFVHEYGRQQAEAVAETVAELRRLRPIALRTIELLMTSEKTTDATKLRSATRILDITQEAKQTGTTTIIKEQPYQLMTKEEESKLAELLKPFQTRN